ncbi:MAG TPA: terminase family protein [Allosphingosinicella sp.]|nr:terminase family protein [Allosphingosinicella sp.]
MDEAERLIATIGALAECSLDEHLYAARRMTQPQRRAVAETWPLWAREGQMPPEGGWRTWLMMAGRGFGKTRAGAEWVSALARAGGPELRIALVGATPLEVERVMVRGESGLMAVAREEEELLWYPSRGLVEFPSGAQGLVFSGANPDGLRGAQHHFAWCDEIAKWAYPGAAFDNLLLGMRLEKAARVLVTTTPRPIALLKRLLAAPDSAVTRGRTADNDVLPDDFVASVTALYGGTRLGRQELDGELVEEAEGALWTRATIEKGRGGAPGALARVAIGVDPPASADGDACGIVVCGLDEAGVGWVLDDRSVRGLPPEGWARAVVRAAQAWEADLVVAETNQGGEMVESVLRSADCALPVRAVKARYGKGKRAEPVSVRFAKGEARFAGSFPELEDELCGLTAGGGYDGPGRSPDRADAMVWALAELMLGVERTVRIRRL